MADIVITNITTSQATTELLDSRNHFGSIKSISISNFSDDAADARVDIFFKIGSNDYYLIKNAMIPKGATLVLDDGYVVPKNMKLEAYSVATAPALTIMVQPTELVRNRR